MNKLLCHIGILALLVLIIPKAVQSQTAKLDSLENLVQQPVPDSVKFKAYSSLFTENLFTDLAKSRVYVREALSLAHHMQDSARVYRMHMFWGVLHRFEGSYDSALFYLQGVVDYYNRTDQGEQSVSALFNLGVVSSFQGKFYTSLAYYMEALNWAEQRSSQFLVADIQNSMGILHKKLKNYPKSLELTYESLKIFEELDRPIQQANCLSNIGSTYLEMQQYDSAQAYFQQAYKLDTLLDVEWGVGHQLYNLALVYSELGDTTQALDYAQQSLAVREKLGQKKEITESLIAVATLQNQLGQSERALTLAQRAQQISREIDAKQELRDANQILSDIHSQSGNFQKAYQTHVAFANLRDSIVNDEIALQINDLQTRYETEKKEKEIALLTQERAVQEAELARMNALLIASIIGCILLGALILVTVRFYRSKMKSKALIAQKNEEISHQKIQELKQREKLISMDAMVSGQEEERKRIAKDLHDGLGSLLANVQIRFSSMEDITHTENSTTYQQTNALLNEACHEVRKIAHDMMPGALVKFGLIPAIQDICQSFEKTTKIHVDFQVYGANGRFEEKKEITIYRIIQELLNNIRKHAQAQEIIVQISVHEGEFTLIVEDDGVGFDVASARTKDGLGLRSLESRVKYIHGKLTIDSTPSQGTTVTVEVPISQEVALV